MFALVENVAVTQVFPDVPDNFIRVSGFNLLSDAERIEHGFYPLREVIPALASGKKAGSFSDEITATEVVRTYVLVNKSAAEKHADIDAAKTSAYQRIDIGYVSVLGANFDYMGTSFQADADSRDILGASITAAGGSVPAGFGWWDVTNIKVPMTFTELQGLANGIFLRGQLAFETRQAKKQLIRDASVVADVEAITWA